MVHGKNEDDRAGRWDLLMDLEAGRQMRWALEHQRWEPIGCDAVRALVGRMSRVCAMVRVILRPLPFPRWLAVQAGMTRRNCFSSAVEIVWPSLPTPPLHPLLHQRICLPTQSLAAFWKPVSAALRQVGRTRSFGVIVYAISCGPAHWPICFCVGGPEKSSSRGSHGSCCA